ncbi:hypothetical protein D3C84_1023870 [compost metagenome]
MRQPEGAAENMADPVTEPVNDRRWGEITLPGGKLKLQQVVDCDQSVCNGAARIDLFRPFLERGKETL